MRLFKLVAVALVAFTVMSVHEAQAATLGSIGIAPGPVIDGRDDAGFHYNARPGQVFSDTVDVINSSDQAKTLRLATVPAKIVSNNGLVCDSTAQDDRETHLKVDPLDGDVTLPAHSHKLVPMSVTVPNGVKGVEYNSCLSAEDGAATGSSGGINLRPRVVLRVSALVDGNLRIVSKVTNLRLHRTGRQLRVTGTLTNNSLTSLRTTSLTTIKSTYIGRGHATRTPQVTTLPNSSTQIISDSMPAPFWGGRYRLRLHTSSTVSLAGTATNHVARQEDLESTVFIRPQPRALYAYMSLGTVFTGSVLLIVYRQRRSRRVIKNV